MRSIDQSVVDLVRALVENVEKSSDHREERGILCLPDSGDYEIIVRRATGPVGGTAIIHTPRRTGE